jgi:decaprenyl-phosphate phosphoribosyltransferase
VPLGPSVPAGPEEIARHLSHPARFSRTPPLVRALRPRQWTKNALVVVAPLAAGRLLDVDVLVGVAIGFVAFCLAASGCYLVNDSCDVELDRMHPEKRLRPVAAGEIGRLSAAVLGTTMMVSALVLAAWHSTSLALTILAYLAVQAAYLLGLKHQPALDLGAVASGFLLRAVAGGAATHTDLSPWFLLVATFGALFVVTGKRYSEMCTHGPDAGTRKSLQHYSESYLRFVWTLAAGVTVTVYLLWALAGPQSVSTGTAATSWAAGSVVFFVLALLRYAARVDAGAAEAPEDVVLRDRHLQVLGLLWTLTILLHAATN